ncbi:hypothetical protein AZI86_05790 [Bdellovibrio bacteriovorus]|uniref:Peptidase C1A papain C-terminal domain-containing protein n=1 Tax=Bdellovibrio bacteriovorus TaxID=959 RepID=A0A150WQS8_BDEBC|nr:hypothetical protein [Bdellovibrio bacteriovorus]KYG66555.1 hypothetical protein AZI86_05790 [Bdellovibrio bacteriovorus]
MKKIIMSLLVLGAMQPAFADSRYPKNIPARTFGSNQDVGSCQAESFVTAIEHQLANHGLFFRASLQHLHAFIWKDREDAKKVDAGLDMTATSMALVNRYSGVIPEYLLPEDLEGVVESSLSTQGGSGKGLRPKIEDMGIYDDRVPVQNFRYSSSFWSFKPGHSNTRSVNDFFNVVRSGRMVTLSFDSAFMYKFSPVTGLLAAPYQTDESLLKTSNHSIAVVGFDDDLGGVIVRNTWNGAHALRAVVVDEGNLSDAERGDLAKFRRKISKKILPGYYLFPYKFIQDMAARGVGGYYEINLDLGAFANVSSDYSKDYEVLKTFFSCDRTELKRSLESVGRSIDFFENPNISEDKKDGYLKRIKMVIYSQMSQSRRTLSFAKQSRRVDGTIDRVKDFYDGKFKNYYCGGHYKDPETNFWPLRGKDRVLENPEFLKLVRQLSISPNDFSAWYELFKLLSKKEYLNDIN